MSNFFLSFPDEAEAIKRLEQWRSQDEEGNDVWLTSSHEHAFHVVGDIYITPATTKSGEQDFPALKAEIVAKVAIEESKKAAAIASAELADVPAEELQVLQEAPIMVKSDGFHINLICPDEMLSEGARAFLVFPKFPKVVWA